MCTGDQVAFLIQYESSIFQAQTSPGLALSLVSQIIGFPHHFVFGLYHHSTLAYLQEIMQLFTMSNWLLVQAFTPFIIRDYQPQLSSAKYLYSDFNRKER